MHVLHGVCVVQVMDEYLEFRNKYGPVDCLDTKTFLTGPRIASETEVTIGCTPLLTHPVVLRYKHYTCYNLLW